MLNLQFAETMELTEAELQDVRGGNLVNSMGGGGRSGISGWGVQEFTLVGAIKDES